MPLIPEDKIAEVRDRTDIVLVIGEYVALRKAGASHVGLCPFHAERTPSFNVIGPKQFFYCHGCGKSGDVFKFLTEHDGRPFIEVVRDLARRAGVDLPEPERTPEARELQRKQETDRAKVLRANQLACEFFRQQYAAATGERARAYVEQKRGIGVAVRDSFQIGYAPPGWDGLVRFLESRKVPHEVAVSAGLVKARENMRLPPGAPPTKATHFDLFRDRVMCPLINPQGEVLAFSGRLLDPPPGTAPDAADSDGGRAAPKYINSPETIVYKKGEQLYGIHVARAAIRKAGRAILVEGNFDVLMMHERGVAETVAPMGTALTAAQVNLLHRAAPERVYLFLDGDSAGRRAAARDVGLFLDEDLLAFVALLPRGEDPDTFVSRHGREALEQLLKRAGEAVEYFCDYAWSGKGASLMERSKLLEEEAAPLIRKVRSEGARRRFAQRLALQLELPMDEIERVLRGARSPVSPVRAEEAQPARGADDGSPVEAPDVLDLDLIALLFDQPQLLQRLRTVLAALKHAELREAVRDVVERSGSARLDAGALTEKLDPSLRAEVARAALSGKYAGIAQPERALDEIARRREILASTVERKRLVNELRTAREPEAVDDLRRRIAELNKKFPNFERDAAKLAQESQS